jgi:hypothetical protein
LVHAFLFWCRRLVDRALGGFDAGGVTRFAGFREVSPMPPTDHFHWASVRIITLAGTRQRFSGFNQPRHHDGLHDPFSKRKKPPQPSEIAACLVRLSPLRSFRFFHFSVAYPTDSMRGAAVEHQPSFMRKTDDCGKITVDDGQHAGGSRTSL